jgi:hypothetical protein
MWEAKNLLLAILGFFFYVLYRDQLIGNYRIVFTIDVDFLFYFLQGRTNKDMENSK